ncbi:MFS transporter [Hydrogenoanaerobacterium sp.]|uniref:MFS transporter n=1 Tax=Hydrogenoanaerobacterium sp. TaxID=2953763 RepID=UPI002897DA5B|nr:MFS transporter [Hydrogenoanaerobacterium sp.]
MKNCFNPFTYVLFLFMGCFFAGNQLMVHYVSASFGATEIQLSMIISALYVGSMLMVLLLGELSERIGKRFGVIIAAISYSIGALFIALSGNLKMSVLSFFLFGCGSGGLEGVMFSLIGDYNGEETNKHMNLTQAVFSIGAVFGPIVIDRLLTVVSYKVVYSVMWLFMGILAIVFLCSRSIDSFSVKSSKGASGGLTIFKLARNPAMFLYMLILMIAIGCETAVTYWLVNYFDLLGAVSLGAFGLSLYWFASIPGRVLGSRIYNQSNFLKLCFLLCSVGIIVLLVLPSPLLKLFGVLIIGIALAPVYPSISTLGGRLFPKNSAAAFSLMVFSCGLGGTIAQPIIGAVSRAASITVVYTAISVIMVILAGLVVLGGKASRHNTIGEEQKTER